MDLRKGAMCRVRGAHQKLHIEFDPIICVIPAAVAFAPIFALPYFIGILPGTIYHINIEQTSFALTILAMFRGCCTLQEGNMPEGHMDSKQNRKKRLNSKQNRKKKQQLIEFYGCYCWWCGNDFSEEELTIEHLIPLSRGGTNNFENLRLACRPCNLSRGNSLYPPLAKNKQDRVR